MLCTDSTPVLSPQLLFAAYGKGAFPMADDDGTIHWYTAEPRAIFPLDEVAPNARFRRFLRNANFRLSRNEAFVEVMAQCAEVHRPTWISPAMITVYSEFHRMGHAHSVETWQGGHLVGGLYGVSMGGVFFAESMFSTAPNASKAAFYHLVDHLKQCGFTLLDSQFINAHTASLGAIEVPKARFEALLANALRTTATF